MHHINPLRTDYITTKKPQGGLSTYFMVYNFISMLCNAMFLGGKAFNYNRISSNYTSLPFLGADTWFVSSRQITAVTRRWLYCTCNFAMMIFDVAWWLLRTALPLWYDEFKTTPLLSEWRRHFEQYHSCQVTLNTSGNHIDFQWDSQNIQGNLTQVCNISQELCTRFFIFVVAMWSVLMEFFLLISLYSLWLLYHYQRNHMIIPVTMK